MKDKQPQAAVESVKHSAKEVNATAPLGASGAKSTVEVQAGGVNEVQVWDWFVRVFHWSLLVLFVFTYFTGDEWKKPHEIAGYAIAALLLARVIWGLVGSQHARFSHFLYSPRVVITFLISSLKLKAQRYLGHNPAGGAMVIALLIDISLICLSGYMMTTDRYWGVGWVNDMHKVTVNTTLILIVLHVAGVILASIEHKENLVKSMWHGRKRAE